MHHLSLKSKFLKPIEAFFFSSFFLCVATTHSMEHMDCETAMPKEVSLKRTLDTVVTILQESDFEERITKKIKVDSNLISRSDTHPNSKNSFYSLPDDLNKIINLLMLQRSENEENSILTTWHPIKIALFIKENMFSGVFCFAGKKEESVENLLKNAQFWNIRISLIWTAPDQSKSNENTDMTIIFNSLNQIKFLNISGNNMNDDSLKSLAIALAKNKTLQYLDLSKNMITYQGAKYLADMLSNNKTLKSIDLSENKIQNAAILEGRLKNQFNYLNIIKQSTAAPSTIIETTMYGYAGGVDGIRKPHRFRPAGTI